MNAVQCSCWAVLLIGLACTVGVVEASEGAEDSVTLMQHTKTLTQLSKKMPDYDEDLSDVHSSTVGGSAEQCAERFAEATNSKLECMSQSSLSNPTFFEYVSNHHDIGESQLVAMWLNMAKADALSTISEDCPPTETLGWDPEDAAFIHFAGRKSAVELVRFIVEMLEDPNVDVAFSHQFGDAELAEVFRTAVNGFRTVCGGEPEQLFDAQEECRDHLNLDAFLEKVQETVTTHSTCTSLESAALMQHRVLRQRRDHTRAKVVQVLHAPKNRLGHHFHAHLHVGGSEFNMDLLISHAVANANLTARQVSMLQHIELSHPLEHLASTCSTWESQRSNTKSVLLQNKDYRTFIDCLCHGNELKVVCQANFMKNMDSLTTDLRRMQSKLDTQKTSIEMVEKLNTSHLPPFIGPCVLADAFSCEVCLSNFCAPLGRPQPQNRKNRANDENPFVVVKNALVETSPTDFKISCTACASLQPGEQVSFEVEMFAATNLANMDSIFTTTKIGVDAKTCIGPGSPIRALSDTLGLNVCMSNLKAEYFPFLGDFDVEGRVLGPHGTLIRLTFGTAIHDPPNTVMSYCRDQVPRTEVRCTNLEIRWRTIRNGWFSFRIPQVTCTSTSTVHLSDAEKHSRKLSCYNGYKNGAGPTLFSAAAVVPLLLGGEFEIVKVSGPHHSGLPWKVEVFQIPFEQVAQAIKEFWDSKIGPVMEDVLNAAGSTAEAAGEWTVGHANSAGDWTVGAFNDVGQSGGEAVDTVGDGLKKGGDGLKKGGDKAGDGLKKGEDKARDGWKEVKGWR